MKTDAELTERLAAELGFSLREITFIAHDPLTKTWIFTGENGVFAPDKRHAALWQALVSREARLAEVTAERDKYKLLTDSAENQLTWLNKRAVEAEATVERLKGERDALLAELKIWQSNEPCPECGEAHKCGTEAELERLREALHVAKQNAW